MIPVHFKNLGLGTPKPTPIRLLMADHTMEESVGILCNRLVMVASFIFLDVFLILDCEVDFVVPIISGSPFLITGRALVDIETGQMKFLWNLEQLTFNVC